MHENNIWDDEDDTLLRIFPHELPSISNPVLTYDKDISKIPIQHLIEGQHI